jgi:hypothetical protein
LLKAQSEICYGLANRNDTWDNVFDLDVIELIDQPKSVYSAAFESPKSVELIRKMLVGLGRNFCDKSSIDAGVSVFSACKAR